MSLIYRITRLALLIIFKIFFRLEVIGSENVSEKGGVIVVTNHVSYLDPLVIGCAIKKRQPRFMARSGLFKKPLIGTFVKTFAFPVDRDNPQPSTIKETVKRLKNGEIVVMFPEGGRSRDGSLLDAKRGTGMIAAMSKAAIVPAFIEGTDRALPAGAKCIRLSKIKVFFGPPIEIKGEGTGKDFQERIGSDIMEAIRSLKVKVEAKVKKNPQPQS